MILVDNSKKAGAVAHLVSLPSLECCPPQIQQVFDAQRQTQFCSFVDDVLHLWIGLGDEESMTLSHVKNAAAAMAKAMRRMKQTEYQVDCADVVKLFGIVTSVRLVQKEKAFAPRIVTPSGIVIVVRLLHL